LNCNDRLEDILILESGDLDEQTQSELYAHLRECPVCAARLARLQRIEACIAGSLGQPEVGPDITASVMSRISGEASRSSRRLVLAYGAGLVAAVCLLLFASDKAGLLRSPSKKQVTVAKAPTPVPAKSIEALPEPAEARGTTEVRRGSQPQGTRRPSLSKIAFRPPRRTSPQRGLRPADAGRGDLRIELRTEGNTSSIVVARGAEHVLEVGVRNKSISTPPDPEASNVERPPLKTVVSVNPMAPTLSEM
jgi:hypothetical protein